MGPKTIHFDKEMPTAIGRALMSWQIVENEIYKLIHAVLNVDPLYSSAIYFEIKSPNHKISLADKLLKLHLDSAEYARFKPLLKRAGRLCTTRNRIAHGQTQMYTKVPISEDEEQIIDFLYDSIFDHTVEPGDKLEPMTAQVIHEYVRDIGKLNKEIRAVSKEIFPPERLLSLPVPQLARRLAALHPELDFGFLMPPDQSSPE